MKKRDEEVEDDVKKIYTSMSKSEIEAILHECKVDKARDKETFAAGEYAKAILLYSFALDKADELPRQGYTEAVLDFDPAYSAVEVTQNARTNQDQQVWSARMDL